MEHTPEATLEAASRDVQVWSYPLIFAQRVRLNFVQPLDPFGPRQATSAGAPVNTFGHQRRLSDPTLTVGVAPNVDTLYSVAWLDVRHNEFELRLPDFGDRYASFQVALPDTTSPIVISRGTPGEPLPTVKIGKGMARLEADGGEVRLRTNWRYVMIVGRILVDGANKLDLAAAHQLQDALTLRSTPYGVPPEPAARDVELAGTTRQAEIEDPATFALALAQVLDDADPDAITDELCRDINRSRIQGIAGLSTASTSAIADGLAQGCDDIERHVRSFGRSANGWAINDVGTDFGDNRLLRAAVAHSQIFINPVSEALYPVCEVDAAGKPLDGEGCAYEITFAAGSLPPVQAFWSLTMYHAKGLLVDNEINRYAIGDRTPGLRFGDDGSLVIRLQHSRPPDDANWLPAPSGPFRLMLRLYRPTTTAWDPPAVVRVDAASR
ncbi:DUF1214 domain-containing protein [Streptomyces sp. NPDC019937]|uniref:DUF1254 domain-containing protein n=1 Tax=Streptomyces sp. NPDC019937 TaxID=3154787 RepID=UPI0033E0676F